MERKLTTFLIGLAIILLGCKKESEILVTDPLMSGKVSQGEIQEYYLFKIQTTCPVRAFNRSGELSKSAVDSLYNALSSEANFHQNIHLKPYTEHLSDTTTSIRISANSAYFRSPFAVSGPIWDETPTNIYSFTTDNKEWTFTSRDTMAYIGLDEHSATFEAATAIRKHFFAYSDGSSFQERFSVEKTNNFIKIKVLKFAYNYLVYEVDQGFWFNEFIGNVSPGILPADDVLLVQEWEHTFKLK